MNSRRFGVLKICPGIWLNPTVFFTSCTEFGNEIDTDIPTYCSKDPDYLLDDFLYDNLSKPQFDVNWSVCSYGEGFPLEAPDQDVRVISEAYAYGSRELIQIVEDSISEVEWGTSIVINPYYDPSENENEEE